MRKTTMIALAIGALGMVSGGTAMAASGKALFSSKGCISCHGAGGDAPIAPNYPKLAGQNAAYLVQQMKDIKSGARDNGQTAAMKPIIAGVSDSEMEAIAGYLSKQKGL